MLRTLTFSGARAHPVVSGEAWLIANQWGGSQDREGGCFALWIGLQSLRMGWGNRTRRVCDQCRVRDFRARDQFAASAQAGSQVVCGRGGGPAGTAFRVRMSEVSWWEQVITVKRCWTLPECEYAVSIWDSRNEPIYFRLEACLVDVFCGAGCGPLPMRSEGAESNPDGVLRFRGEDLRAMEGITAVDKQVRRESSRMKRCVN